MKNLAIANRARLHPGIALPAVERVAAQARADIQVRHRQRTLQLRRILNGHAGPLRQIGPHGVGSIANQAHQTPGHALGARQRRTVRQRPQPPLPTAGLDAAHHIPQCRATALQRTGQLQGIGGMVPLGQVFGCGAFDNHHQIQKLAPAHRVVHGMQLRAQPDVHLVGAPSSGHIGHGNQGPVSQMTTDARSARIAQHTTPQLAPNAIGQQ